MLLCCVLRVDRDENVKNNANCLKAEKRCIGMMELAIKSNANLKLHLKELLGRIILKNSKEISFFS